MIGRSTLCLFVVPVFFLTAGNEEDKKPPTQSVKISNTSVWKSLSVQLIGEGRGVLTIEGEFDLGKESDAKKIKVHVIVPDRSEEKGALVETHKGRGKFSLKLSREGGPNFSGGGYEVHVLLYREGKEAVHRKLYISQMEPAIVRPILKSGAKHKLDVEDSTIKFDTGSPTSGKTNGVYFIKGTGTYDPGKCIAGLPCIALKVKLRAQDENMQVQDGTTVYADGVWSGQITMNIKPGDYTVWAELDVNDGIKICTDSVTKEVPLPVEK